MEQTQKKKLGRPFGTHRNKNFGFINRNDVPVILLPPPGYIPMTDERFQYLISKQKEWASEYLIYKHNNTNYKRNKEWFKEYFKKYNEEKKLDKDFEEQQNQH
jgi:hypothetical protein